MKISTLGLNLIKQSEGLELKSYICPAGVPTIGYGSTGKHVRRNQTITEADAEALLRLDLVRFEKAVASLNVPLTQGQFDACVSLAFNIGTGAFLASTLARMLKAGDYKGASAQFARWTKAGGKTLVGLVKRRAAEARLFVS